MAVDGPFRRRPDGIDIFVRLTPKSARHGIEGIETTADGRAHIKARVRAVPEKGKANQALVRLMADTFGVPSSAVSIVSGDTARLKMVRIVCDAAMIEDAIMRVGDR